MSTKRHSPAQTTKAPEASRSQAPTPPRWMAGAPRNEALTAVGGQQRVGARTQLIEPGFLAIEGPQRQLVGELGQLSRHALLPHQALARAWRVVERVVYGRRPPARRRGRVPLGRAQVGVAGKLGHDLESGTGVGEQGALGGAARAGSGGPAEGRPWSRSARRGPLTASGRSRSEGIRLMRASSRGRSR
jgi:hypothetical protein